MEKQMNSLLVFNPLLSANMCGVFCSTEDRFTSVPLGQLLWDWTSIMDNSSLAQIMGKKKHR